MGNFVQKGGMDEVDRALENGLVLVMSLWDDHFANMLWLDSIYPTDSKDSTNFRGSCGIDSGLPADVEKNHAGSNVVFSNIRYGNLGHDGPWPFDGCLDAARSIHLILAMEWKCS